ncbi:MAG: NADH-quinone oxidoreductase subunit J [marine benthic group bacterium]|jgi:NADH-quinone oxidoreductase subunit J|nr:NADH-quinone oxidoreductase subunit J [Gemmatimonadota bacterium]MCL7961701.1 NADH-quinone oxidoreductase subunit J [Candidatus Carthagonibacter metallireducens]MCL7937526.1 NADH-quinone oxidoreductase subunit J [Gemmatimonadota bacterium]MCL7957114.1 NADH-quinone oxidoreductase subunit J [Gemmatimonadota bacterium]MCL7964368.1 NADH-quinone oxidoreductase subunit J [Gemmatimonadota bacterium]
MMEAFFFLLFATMAAGGAIMMIASRNPVSSLMYLVLAFFALSGVFVMLDAHFLAAVQVIVYAGAIMVLFLFVIMLLNLGHREDIDMRGHLARLVALVAGSGLFAAVAALVFRGEQATLAGEESRLAVEAMIRSRGAVGALAEPLFTSYLVPFELTALLLLVAIVGAVVLARRRAP